jgi:hypothetical protein
MNSFFVTHRSRIAVDRIRADDSEPGVLPGDAPRPGIAPNICRISACFVVAGAILSRWVGIE